jgi:8-oxo-dGTP pyrophosphatase MutT (NUDIX family)
MKKFQRKKIGVTPDLQEISKIVWAAGGILSRSEFPDKIAIIKRVRYGDEWTLPKGKLLPGESLREVALREVKEETGFDVELKRLAHISFHT